MASPLERDSTPPAGRSRKRKPWVRVAEFLLAGGSLLFVLATLEGGLRVDAALSGRRDFEAALKREGIECTMPEVAHVQ